MFFSSSTTRILYFCMVPHRQFYGEPRPLAELALDGDCAPVVLHDPVDHSEPEARAPRLSSIKRLEDICNLFRLDAGPRVLDRHPSPLACKLRGDGDRVA